MNIELIKQTLDSYTSQFPSEADPYKALELLEKDKVVIERGASLSSHFTCSAILTNPSRTMCLFIWHRKLARWLQPGGHIETEIDISLVNTAERELNEEVNFKSRSARLLAKEPIDFDMHFIGNKTCYYHLDFRYLFECSEEDVPNNQQQGWLTINSLLLEEESIARFSRKIQRRCF